MRCNLFSRALFIKPLARSPLSLVWCKLSFKMAPKLSEEEIDDLIYFARAGEVSDLHESLAALSSREAVSPAEILIAAKDESKSTCLHMATGNGNLGASSSS